MTETIPNGEHYGKIMGIGKSYHFNGVEFCDLDIVYENGVRKWGSIPAMTDSLRKYKTQKDGQNIRKSLPLDVRVAVANGRLRSLFEKRILELGIEELTPIIEAK